jgi:hypothetical protein
MLSFRTLLGGFLAHQAAANCEVCYEGAAVPIVDGMADVTINVYSFFTDAADIKPYLATEFELFFDDLGSVELSITHGGFESTFKDSGSCDFNGMISGLLCQQDCNVSQAAQPLSASCVDGDNEIRGPDNNADWIGSSNDGILGDWTFSVMSSNVTGDGNVTGFCVVAYGIECSMFDSLTPPPTMAPTMTYTPVEQWCSPKKAARPVVYDNFTIEVDAAASAAILANPDSFFFQARVEQTYISDYIFFLNIDAPSATMKPDRSLPFYNAACSIGINMTLMVSDMSNQTLCQGTPASYYTDKFHAQTLNQTFTDYLSKFDSVEGTWMIIVNDTFAPDDFGVVDDVCIGLLGTRAPSISPTMLPTMMPTMMPSGSPTMSPSGSPTMMPTPRMTTTEDPSNASVFSALLAIIITTVFSLFAQ